MTKPREVFYIAEIFHTIQGEGLLMGTPAVFVRFSGCNLKCSADDHNGPENNVGFDCDANFSASAPYTGHALLNKIAEVRWPTTQWVVLTGGEPGLQVDEFLCNALHNEGYKIAIETNGTVELPKKSTDPITVMDLELKLAPQASDYLIDYICVSPKSAEHTLRQPVAHEVKYVINADSSEPRPAIVADAYLLSPAFNGNYTAPDGYVRPDQRAVQRCFQIMQQGKNTPWRLSLQTHKFIGVR